MDDRWTAQSDTLPSPVAGATPGGARFGPAERLAGRYQIVRFLARGGMGEVYEAEDLLLGERVALKTIRAEIAGDPTTVERFRREINLARKVTHTNVCRVFEVMHDGDVLFLTMELLAGESLAARLRRAGPMSVDEALPIVRQLAAGLDAAHGAGVIHRDFKCQNVMLVEGRAVVTDFGLARLLDPDEEHVSVTGEAVVGTAAYMSPEQLAGRPVTAAADIYALGVVLHELITGRRPGDGATTTTRWAAVIERCLARDPSERFARAGDVVAALALPPRRRRWLIPVAVALIALAAVGATALRHDGSRVAPGHHSVAVVGFKSLSGRPESAWLSTALVETLSAQLAATRKIRTIRGEDIARAKLELKLADSESFDKETLGRLREDLGSEYVVVGSYLGGADGAVVLNMRLQDTSSGETLLQLSERGHERDLGALVSDAGRQLQGKLGVDETTPHIRGTLPHDPRAVRFYAEGIDRLRAYQPAKARELLERAVAVEPDHPMIRGYLAAALEGMGRSQQAAVEKRKAFELSDGLPRELRLLIEAYHRAASGDFARATAIFRELNEYFPDDVEYATGLADVLSRAGKPAEAIAALDGMRRRSPILAEDPSVDIAEAMAADRMSDWSREAAAAARAAVRSRARGATLLYANARGIEGYAGMMLRDDDAAAAAIEEARAIFSEAGNIPAEAGVLSIVAIRLDIRGEMRAALVNQLRMVEIFRDLGNLQYQALSLHNAAFGELMLGQTAAATAHCREALAIANEIDDLLAKIWCTGQLARLKVLDGDLAGAARLNEELRAHNQTLGDPRVRLGGQLMAASLRWYAGDMAAARALFDSRPPHTGPAVQDAEMELIVARFAGDDGRPADAEAASRRVLEIIGKGNVKDPAARAAAHASLAEALVRQGHGPEARAEIAQALALLPGAEKVSHRLTVRLAAARVNGDVAQAEEARDEAARLGLYPWLLESRLALGELKRDRAALVELEREAKAKGFLRIAQRAAAARR